VWVVARFRVTGGRCRREVRIGGRRPKGCSVNANVSSTEECFVAPVWMWLPLFPKGMSNVLPGWSHFREKSVAKLLCELILTASPLTVHIL
jgi:hypothetical protein